DDDYENASIWTTKIGVAKSYAEPLRNRMQEAEDDTGRLPQELTEGVTGCELAKKDTKGIENRNGRHRIRTYDFHRVRMAL
ncbi:MAG: hypothetical protein RL595_138, partial [Planctomycetota bacterium]